MSDVPLIVSPNQTRAVRIGSITIGGGHPIAVQSMCATHTHDVEATTAQVLELERAGADVVRVAVDTPRDATAVKEIRQRTNANLCIDLQEAWPLAVDLAPHVDKIRYNPGHLYHRDRSLSWQDKVRTIADAAAEHDCAIRVGVNCGSIDPETADRFEEGDRTGPMLASALSHAAFLDEIGFTRFVVSLKDSDPLDVIEVNKRFAAERPDVPLHLGVTEAGLPPDGIVKSRVALEQLVGRGIGNTIRISLTLPHGRKGEEIEVGRQILADIAAGRVRSVVDYNRDGLNIISCPSCSRVENEAFVELAQQVKDMTEYAKDHRVTIAVMGCRVNGPGETDEADLGLWCGATRVNLKRGPEKVGTFGYDDILDRLKAELDKLIAERDE